MLLWLLFGNQWLHTQAHDLMRAGDPEKEDKFYIVVKEEEPLVGVRKLKMKFEACAL